MPVELKGFREFQRGLNKFEPDLKKNLDKELTVIMKPMVLKARGYMPASISGLSNWTLEPKSKKITAKTTMFRRGRFPKYQAAIARAGIKFLKSPTKPNRQGFSTLYRLENQSAAGAIFETAGRKNPMGQPWDPSNASHKYSHSMNPYAGNHFIKSVQSASQLKGSDKMRGRAMFRAWDEDQGRTLGAFMKAINKTVETVATGMRKAA